MCIRDSAFRLFSPQLWQYRDETHTSRPIRIVTHPSLCSIGDRVFRLFATQIWLCSDENHISIRFFVGLKEFVSIVHPSTSISIWIKSQCSMGCLLAHL